MSERTWPENAKPTPEQFADWFVSIPREERIERAEVLLDAMERADACFVGNHARLLEEVQRAHRRARRYFVAWTSARRRIHPDRFLRMYRAALNDEDRP